MSSGWCSNTNWHAMNCQFSGCVSCYQEAWTAAGLLATCPAVSDDMALPQLAANLHSFIDSHSRFLPQPAVPLPVTSHTHTCIQAQMLSHTRPANLTAEPRQVMRPHQSDAAQLQADIARQGVDMNESLCHKHLAYHETAANKANHTRPQTPVHSLQLHKQGHNHNREGTVPTLKHI